MLTDLPKTRAHAVCEAVEREVAKAARRDGFAWGIPVGVILTLAALVLLAGCAAVELREENGPLGPATFRVTPVPPPALVHRSVRSKRTEATPTTPAISEDECESGICATPK